MRFTPVPSRLEGPILIEPTMFPDDRGFFGETYRRADFVGLGIVEEFKLARARGKARAHCA